MTSFAADFTFTFHPSRREQFRDGSLINEWATRYPQIFDADDVRIMRTKHQRQYHFYEWLSAVLIFEATGFLSLVEKYTANNHPRARSMFQSLVPPDLFEFLVPKAGLPDLFVYHPVSKDWFFCEIKGGRDSVRKHQQEIAAAILTRTKRPVRFVHLAEIKPLPASFGPVYVATT